MRALTVPEQFVEFFPSHTTEALFPAVKAWVALFFERWPRHSMGAKVLDKASRATNAWGHRVPMRAIYLEAHLDYLRELVRLYPDTEEGRFARDVFPRYAEELRLLRAKRQGRF